MVNFIWETGDKNMKRDKSKKVLTKLDGRTNLKYNLDDTNPS